MVIEINPQFKKGQGDIVELTAGYRATNGDFLILVDASGGAIIIDLPNPVGWGGKRFVIKKTDSSTNTVTVQVLSGETIDGATSFSLTEENEILEIISDNENYRILEQREADPTFINLKLSGDQSSINAETEVAFVLESSNGLSVTSKRVTLLAGKTYVLSASLRHAGSGAATSAKYTWRDYTNSVDLGTDSLVNSQNDTTNDGTQPTAVIIIKPTTDIDVGVICTFVNTSGQGLAADSTQASIHSV